jgi:xanthine dehydrogenase YagR molybdenum-binding subunit
VTSVGRPIDRVDARAKVTGQAAYTADVAVDRVAHAVIVTSAIARGKLVALDAVAARRAPGVLAVLAHDNAPRLPRASQRREPSDRVLQVLQDDAIVYADQPIAVAIAETLEAAQRAANLVVARYEAAPAIGDLARAMDAARLPKTAGPRGEATSRRGDFARAFAGAPVKIDRTYTTPVHVHNPMEPHATLAEWREDDRHPPRTGSSPDGSDPLGVLIIHDATQGIFHVRERIAWIFELAPDRVRVISQFLGGGFGCKGTPWSHVVLAAMAARAVKRPVKLVLTRHQMFAFVGHRPPTVQHVRLGADRDGKLRAIAHDVVNATSRVDEFVEPSAMQTRMLYACDDVETSHRVAPIDVATPTFTRAPGEASGSFALECAMDELAYALRMDPLELRLRNHADRDLDTNRPWSSKSLRDCYKQAGAAFGWSRRSFAPRSMRDNGVLVGWGMATATYPARQLAASAVARIRADGTAVVQTGTQDLGTGTYTIMTQLAADALGLPVAAVTFELGDTMLPEAPQSAGSLTASSTGTAVAQACDALRAALVAAAIADPRSPLHARPARSIVAEGGALVDIADRGRRDAFAAIVRRSGRPEIRAEHASRPAADRERRSTHAFGADFCEVRVDEALGQVRVSRFVAAFACGRILNAKTARSQLVGGIVWSIGAALEEHAECDPRTARVVTRDLADYHVPVHADVPDVTVLTIDEDDRYVNAIGAKGLGEIGNTGAAAAIANAVFHATGKRVRELPITPDKLV